MLGWVFFGRSRRVRHQHDRLPGHLTGSILLSHGSLLCDVGGVRQRR
jgi:hypothetical protein